MIGEFEYLVLAACVRLGDGAYGASIASLIEETTARRCSSGALYLTLDRLEAKSMVATRTGEPTAERGGRAKRMVRVTGAGRAAAAEFHRAIAQVSRGIRWEKAAPCAL